MMSSASAVAWTSSIARATMLRYGLRRIDSSAPVRRRAPRARAGGAGRRRATTRAAGPSRYGSSSARAPGARWTTGPGPRGTPCPTPAGARLRPSLETIRPSFIGYSLRVVQRDEPRLALERRRLEASDDVDGRAARGEAPPRAPAAGPAARPASGARDQPPTRTLTGWIGPPAEERQEVVADLLEPQAVGRRAARWSGPARQRSGSPGSRGRGAGRCGARGSRSTRRSRGAGGGRGPGGST